jgi:hypothetical protein
MVPTIGAETMTDFTTAETTSKRERENREVEVDAANLMPPASPPRWLPSASASSRSLSPTACAKNVSSGGPRFMTENAPGLFVSITTSGVATFYYKFTNPGTGKQCTGWLGVYNPETFNVEHARTKVYVLRGNGAVAIVETMRQQKEQHERQGR